MYKTKEGTVTVKMRKMEYLGYIMRNKKYRLLQHIRKERLTVEGDREGEKIRGSKTCADGYEMSSLELFRQEDDRVKIAMIIANVRRE